MQACPTCHTTYADDLRYCTQDATALVTAPNPPAEPPRAAAAPVPTRAAAPTAPISTAMPAATAPPRQATARTAQPYAPAPRPPSMAPYRAGPTPTAPTRPMGGPLLKFSGFAVWAFIFSLCYFFLAPLAIVFGHVARRQAKRGKRRGGGLAMAALVIGYISLPFSIGIWVAVLQN